MTTLSATHRDFGGTRLTSYGDASRLSGAALFLDRDGVLVPEVGYLHRIEDLALLPGAAEVVAAANCRAVPVIVITNQAGIGRGYYGWREFDALQDEIQTRLKRQGAALDAVIACPFHADGESPYRHADHPDRKPNPGMFELAAETFGLELERSWFVGDTLTDIQAGLAAGLEGLVHVRTGHGERDRPLVERLPEEPRLRCADDLAAAAGLIPLLNREDTAA